MTRKSITAERISAAKSTKTTTARKKTATPTASRVKITAAKADAPGRTRRPKTAPVSTTRVEPKPDVSPTHEEIAKRAFEIWLSHGRPEGRAFDDWCEAEAQLQVGI